MNDALPQVGLDDLYQMFSDMFFERNEPEEAKLVR
jgi:hypothetical protein